MRFYLGNCQKVAAKTICPLKCMGRLTTMQSLFLNHHQEFLKGGEGSKDTVVSTPKITP